MFSFSMVINQAQAACEMFDVGRKPHLGLGYQGFGYIPKAI
ncbi:hypothetical protein MNBD_GAMMA17-336 [hydrothermal vent metagenome]|uniref:Uncharacterized protein n=1 Tax=hydrothermal vent metagenome TaxID=652676 RepID=A0A3B0ZAM0_9ZZZZ